MVSEYAVRILAYLAILSMIGLVAPWYIAEKISTKHIYSNDCNTGHVGNFVPIAVIIIFWGLIGISPRGQGYVYACLLGMSGMFVIRHFLFRQWVTNLEIFAYFSILLLSTRWIWWNKSVFSINELAPFMISAIIVTGLAVISKIDIDVGKRRLVVYLFGLIVVILSGVYFISVKSLIGHDNLGMWHHVSAYVGSAELVATGVIPLVDIALQYGAGYTWLTSAFGCSTDCWSAIAWSQHLTNLIWAGALAMACYFAPTKWTAKLLLFAIIGWGASIVLLTNYPPDLLPALGTPSTKGMRFWPLAAMAAYVLIGSRYKWFSKMLGFGRFGGHLLWISSIAWSPEAGIQTGILWAGALQWNAIVNNRSFIYALLVTVVEILIVFIVGVIFLLTGFWTIFGLLPDLNLYILYIIIPWGTIAMNFGGAVIFIFAFLLFCGLELRKRIQYNLEGWETTSLYLTTLIAIMGLSYFVNRPHDNNFLNVVPFLLPAMLSMAIDSKYQVFKLAFTWCLVLPIIWIPYYGFASLSRYLERDVNYEKSLSKAWSFTNPNSVAQKTIVVRKSYAPSFKELIELVIKIRKTGDPYTIVDTWNVTDAGIGSAPWSAYRNASPWSYLRPVDRQSAIRNVAKRLKRDGWLIVQRSPYWIYNDKYSTQEILFDFDCFYQRVKTIEVQHYIAVKYHYADSKNDFCTFAGIN